MLKRAHDVQVWMPAPKLFRLSTNSVSRKWLGYVDQYISFPREVRKKLKSVPDDTLFVFTDHALGPWVPLVADRPHVIHCHDFMAQFSALGMIPQNKTGLTGKLYQSMIRKGFSKGNHFISVSRKTRTDLELLLDHKPVTSEVVYNGFHRPFTPVAPEQARRKLASLTNLPLAAGYLLHVGGNMWYKNRRGVIEMYDAFRRQSPQSLPLILVGEHPTEELVTRQRESPYAADIHWISNLEDSSMDNVYAGATALLFPSLGEGFGWPIAEAMSCGCPVIVTNLAPMSEVAGSAALLIPQMPSDTNGIKGWAEECAQSVLRIAQMNSEERKQFVQHGLDNAKRFNSDGALDQIQTIYRRILNGYTGK